MLFHGNMIITMLRHAQIPQFRQSQFIKIPGRVKLQNCVRLLAKPRNESPFAWRSHRLQRYRRDVNPVSPQMK